jgi:ferredoxin-NADP reductase
MSSSSGLLAGAFFVGLAAVNVFLVLEASRVERSQKTRQRLIRAHRIGGYSFVIAFCIMTYLMSKRLIGAGLSELPAYLVLHVALALVLIPLLFLKILIARRYKQRHSSLMPLGLTIFITSCVLVAIPALSEVLRSPKPESLVLKLTVLAMISLCLYLGSSVLRSKKQIRSATANSSPMSSLLPTSNESGRSVSRNAKSLMTLLLSRIDQQTHDTKTLRFLVPRETRIQAKPGQFLTFHWNINGKRVLRSYTVSSSPTNSEYVEITPKRVKDGSVSCFLHDQAKLGLTVVASGPHGEFYFDEAIHRSIVLIAAGSGITPMISILRYIDDLHISTPVTLLYCVRTRKDIIFETELERLKNSLPNFKCGVSLSQPDETWKGHSGRFNREFLLDMVAEFETPTFFLCGPSGFMANAHQVLNSLGVDESRVAEESFGEPKVPANTLKQNVDDTVGAVEFALSHKICELHAGSTLLEVAERNGVRIPYGCRQGQCGTCATRLLCGSVRMDTKAGLTAEQKDAGYVLPCVSRGEGTLVLAA